jgi:predicted amidohydrolase
MGKSGIGMQIGRRNVFSWVSPILLLLFSCGIMENMDDYQYLSSPNGWSGKTKFDDSRADTWFDIASVSMTVSRDPAVNRATMERKVREIVAARPQVEIILFGETTTGWYLGESDKERNKAYQDSIAETVPGTTSGLMQDLARELGVYIAFGIAERSGTDLFNTLILVNPAGEIQAIHRKYLTVHSNVVTPLDYPYRNGDGATVTEIDGIPFGLMICNDMHSWKIAKGFTDRNVKVILSALADKGKAPEADGWSPIPPVYDAWVIQANRYGTEGKEIYPGAISIPDPAGYVRGSMNGDGWIASRIGVYR